MNHIDPEILDKVTAEFAFEEKVEECIPYGKGHIHLTYLVTTESGKKYILQRINEEVWKDIPKLMRNIHLVTEYLKKQTEDPRRVISLIKTKSGKELLSHESGHWRVYSFVENSICLQRAESNEDFYQSAIAFGQFEEMLKDFPIEELSETIPDFHNTPNRYRIFHEVCEKDPMGRKKEVEKEISFLLEREEEMGVLQRMRDAGELPTRATHNDTKLNNVLLDAETKEALCVIDLDTVMPGLSLYDFGDAIRFGAATADEDEKDLSKVEMSLERFQAFTEGFIKSCQNLTEKEVEYLPMGAKVMTLECGLRFLTDYLDGDHYFSIDYPEQNLDRCRTQLKLAADMEKKWDEMKRITDRSYSRKITV